MNAPTLKVLHRHYPGLFTQCRDFRWRNSFGQDFFELWQLHFWVDSAIKSVYPAEADIDTFLSDLGLELITENNANFIQHYKQYIWGILNALRWASSLSVYCPSPTTFNVRGGKYLFNGTGKTYSPGSAVDPTDNDTTYVWLKPDNSFDSGIDGDGWPATEHVKLAEIDVDSDDIIMDARDLRGQICLNYASKKPVEAHTANDTLTQADSGSIHTNLRATGTVTLTLPALAPAGTIFTFAVQQAQELPVDLGAEMISVKRIAKWQ